jgi:hypothetical protein
MTNKPTEFQDDDWRVRCACNNRDLESLATLLHQFLARLSTPLFRDGDRVRWIPLSEDGKTDTGMIIGRFLAYAHHRKDWQWKYLLWLQPPCGTVVADTAWESDLELLKRTNDESTPSEPTRATVD